MDYLAVKDLKAPRLVREKLAAEGDLMVMNNGKPMALMLHLAEGENPQELLDAVQSARARLALMRLCEQARTSGVVRMRQKDIAAEIQAVRRARRR